MGRDNPNKPSSNDSPILTQVWDNADIDFTKITEQRPIYQTGGILDQVYGGSGQMPSRPQQGFPPGGGVPGVEMNGVGTYGGQPRFFQQGRNGNGQRYVSNPALHTDEGGRGPFNDPDQVRRITGLSRDPLENAGRSLTPDQKEDRERAQAQVAEARRVEQLRRRQAGLDTELNRAPTVSYWDRIVLDTVGGATGYLAGGPLPAWADNYTKRIIARSSALAKSDNPGQTIHNLVPGPGIVGLASADVVGGTSKAASWKKQLAWFYQEHFGLGTEPKSLSGTLDRLQAGRKVLDKRIQKATKGTDELAELVDVAKAEATYKAAELTEAEKSDLARNLQLRRYIKEMQPVEGSYLLNNRVLTEMQLSSADQALITQGTAAELKCDEWTKDIRKPEHLVLAIPQDAKENGPLKSQLEALYKKSLGECEKELADRTQEINEWMGKEDNGITNAAKGQALKVKNEASGIVLSSAEADFLHEYNYKQALKTGNLDELSKAFTSLNDTEKANVYYWTELHGRSLNLSKDNVFTQIHRQLESVEARVGKIAKRMEKIDPTKSLTEKQAQLVEAHKFLSEGCKGKIPEFVKNDKELLKLVELKQELHTVMNYLDDPLKAANNNQAELKAKVDVITNRVGLGAKEAHNKFVEAEHAGITGKALFELQEKDSQLTNLERELRSEVMTSELVALSQKCGLTQSEREAIVDYHVAIRGVQEIKEKSLRAKGSYVATEATLARLQVLGKENGHWTNLARGVVIAEGYQAFNALAQKAILGDQPDRLAVATPLFLGAALSPTLSRKKICGIGLLATGGELALNYYLPASKRAAWNRELQPNMFFDQILGTAAWLWPMKNESLPKRALLAAGAWGGGRLYNHFMPGSRASLKARVEGAVASIQEDKQEQTSSSMNNAYKEFKQLGDLRPDITTFYADKYTNELTRHPSADNFRASVITCSAAGQSLLEGGTFVGNNNGGDSKKGILARTWDATVASVTSDGKDRQFKHVLGGTDYDIEARALTYFLIAKQGLDKLGSDDGQLRQRLEDGIAKIEGKHDITEVYDQLVNRNYSTLEGAAAIGAIRGRVKARLDIENLETSDPQLMAKLYRDLAVIALAASGKNVNYRVENASTTSDIQSMQQSSEAQAALFMAWSIEPNNPDLQQIWDLGQAINRTRSGDSATPAETFEEAMGRMARKEQASITRRSRAEVASRIRNPFNIDPILLKLDKNDNPLFGY